MKYIRQFQQETVRATEPYEFDQKMNEIFAKANKDIEVHYFDTLGLCATIRYWVSKDVPEDICDEYELRGERYYCGDCDHFELPSDRRYKYGSCDVKSSRPQACTRACVIFYKELEEAKNAATV